MFVGRERELEFLNGAYEKGGFQLIPVYGRRRVGKTELILQFIRDKKAIYFLATSGTKRENIEKFKSAAKKITDLSPIKNEWEDLFEYIANNIKERTIVVIDEFPYLMDTERGLSSTFQRIADLHLKNSEIFLILAGSNLGMMWKEVLAYRAPLYGRRTGQVELKPLKLRDANRFIGKNFEEFLRTYSICGGMPAYLREFVEKKEFFELISKKTLARNSVLGQEVPFLMRQEFREPRTYMSILSAISLGMSSLGKIINFCGFKDKAGIAPYLQNMESVGYITRELPVTESQRSKKGVYVIKDNFFRFWFRYIRANESMIEENPEYVLKRIKMDFEHYLSGAFENICKEALTHIMPAKYPKIGKWWESTKEGAEEIDIVALNEETKEALFAECKWQEKVNPEEVLRKLNEKTKYVSWHDQARKETLAVFAKSFSKKITEYEGKPATCIDLKDLERHIMGKAESTEA